MAGIHTGHDELRVHPSETSAFRTHRPGERARVNAEVLAVPVFHGHTNPDIQSFGLFGLGKRNTSEAKEKRERQKADRRERRRRWRAEDERRRQIRKRISELSKTPEFAPRIAEAKARIKVARKEYKKAYNTFADFGWLKHSVGAFATKGRVIETASDTVKGLLIGAAFVSLAPPLLVGAGAIAFVVGAIQSIKGLITGNGYDFRGGLKKMIGGVVASLAGLIFTPIAYGGGLLVAPVLGAQLGGAIGFLKGFINGFQESRDGRLARIVDPSEARLDKEHRVLRKIYNEMYQRADSDIPPLEEA